MEQISPMYRNCATRATDEGVLLLGKNTITGFRSWGQVEGVQTHASLCKWMHVRTSNGFSHRWSKLFFKKTWDSYEDYLDGFDYIKKTFQNFYCIRKSTINSFQYNEHSCFILLCTINCLISQFLQHHFLNTSDGDVWYQHVIDIKTTTDNRSQNILLILWKPNPKKCNTTPFKPCKCEQCRRSYRNGSFRGNGGK